VILVDTSVWLDHLRSGVQDLMAELDRGTVLMHPFVLGELACGNLRNRTSLLGLLGGLPSAVSATDAETLAFIERRALHGKGIGYLDAHLLASVQLTAGATLWTRDRRLRGVAESLGCAFQPRGTH
jgi:predicted nucleic acid-binding protein